MISGHTIYNVSATDSTATLVQGNIIGPAADGFTSLNVPTRRGVSIEGSSTSSVIGASAPGGAGGNVIAYAAIGVRVLEPAIRTTILGNSMFEISRIGIDLNGDGVSANDACDADTRANLTQNFPVLTGATRSGGGFTVSGTLNSAPNATYRVEFFASSLNEDGPARTRLGSTTGTTDSNCVASFTFPTTQPPGTAITATATDANGNTSEFSAGLALLASSTLVTKTFNPTTIAATRPVRLTITLTNPDPVAVTAVRFADVYPAGLTNAPSPDVASTCGGSVAATAGGNGVTLTGGTIAGNTSCTVSVSVQAAAAGTFTNTIPTGGVMSANGTPNQSPATAVLAANPAVEIPTLSPIVLLFLTIALAAAASLAIRGT